MVSVYSSIGWLVVSFCPVANVFWNACNDYSPYFCPCCVCLGFALFFWWLCIHGVVFLSLDRLENVQAFFMACRGMLDMQVSDAFASSVLGTQTSNPALLCFCCALYHQDGMLFSANDLLDGKNLDKVLTTLIEFAKRMVRTSGGVVGTARAVAGTVERLFSL